MYLMNRDGFSLLVMGFTGEKALQWKIKYIEAFNAMEKELARPTVSLPNFNDPVEMARAWADEFEAKQKALKQIEMDKPKIAFAEAIQASKDCISVSLLARILWL